jgi:hypothetical protein
MATNEEELKPLDLENTRAEQEQEELKRAAQTDKVVRGVNGSLAPAARKLRPLAGIIIIVIVVLAALYMRQGMASRNKKTAKQAETAKVGVGPATTVEKGLLSDQARSGLDTGQMHVPDSLTPRSSITSPDGPGKTRSSSVPPIEYKQGSVSTATNGSLSFAEQRRLDEYNREREALEAATSVKGNLPSEQTQRSGQRPDDPLGDTNRPHQRAGRARLWRRPTFQLSAGRIGATGTANRIRTSERSGAKRGLWGAA